MQTFRTFSALKFKVTYIRTRSTSKKFNSYTNILLRARTLGLWNEILCSLRCERLTADVASCHFLLKKIRAAWNTCGISAPHLLFSIGNLAGWGSNDDGILSCLVFARRKKFRHDERKLRNVARKIIVVRDFLMPPNRDSGEKFFNNFKSSMYDVYIRAFRVHVFAAKM